MKQLFLALAFFACLIGAGCGTSKPASHFNQPRSFGFEGAPYYAVYQASWQDFQLVVRNRAVLSPTENAEEYRWFRAGVRSLPPYRQIAMLLTEMAPPNLKMEGDTLTFDSAGALVSSDFSSGAVQTFDWIPWEAVERAGEIEAEMIRRGHTPETMKTVWLTFSRRGEALSVGVDSFFISMSPEWESRPARPTDYPESFYFELR